MDLREDSILKLAALGWDGKEDPIKFMLSEFSAYGLRYTYSKNDFIIYWKWSVMGGNSFFNTHKYYSGNADHRQRKVIETMLCLFRTENGVIHGPNYDNRNYEWT